MCGFYKRLMYIRFIHKYIFIYFIVAIILYLDFCIIYLAFMKYYRSKPEFDKCNIANTMREWDNCDVPRDIFYFINGDF